MQKILHLFLIYNTVINALLEIISKEMSVLMGLLPGMMLFSNRVPIRPQINISASHTETLELS